MQRLTPVDILNLRFRRGLNGYSIAEVDEFLRRVAGDLEIALTEGAAFRERIGTLEREVSQYRALEATLRDALILAQKAADETRTAARAQADALILDAQARSRDLETRTQERLYELTGHIEVLRQERRRLARDLRAQLTAHLAFLEQELEYDDSRVTLAPPPATPDIALPLPSVPETVLTPILTEESDDTPTIPVLPKFGVPTLPEQNGQEASAPPVRIALPSADSASLNPLPVEPVVSVIEIPREPESAETFPIVATPQTTGQDALHANQPDIEATLPVVATAAPPEPEIVTDPPLEIQETPPAEPNQPMPENGFQATCFSALPLEIIHPDMPDTQEAQETQEAAAPALVIARSENAPSGPEPAARVPIAEEA